MAVFINSTKHVVQMVGYRADGLIFDQDAPEIAPGQARYINKEHFGDNDWYFVIAYMKDAVVPDRIGVTQAVSGGGAGLGVTISGSGGSISVSGTKTTYYSDGVAAVSTLPHSTWELVERNHGRIDEWGFTHGGKFTKDMLHGW